MEIPFIVNVRKDTGLFNSKVGIWLFLASEVTLFGGLFSGYLFLRLYADYPWPERALPVLPGLINTFVLIGSSVTVVFAWAALKMREWRKFQVYMSITLVCALLFMVLKGIEYNAKLGHQAVQIDGDGPVQGFEIVEGHKHKAKIVGGIMVDADTVDRKLEEFSEANGEELFSKTLAPALTLLQPLVVLQMEARSGLKGEGISEEEVESKEKIVADTEVQISKVLASLGGGAIQALVRSKFDALADMSPTGVVVLFANGLEGTEEEIAEAIKASLAGAAKSDLKNGVIDAGYANKIAFKASELTFVLTRPTHEAYVDEILKQAGDTHTITLNESYRVINVDELYEGKLNRTELLESESALIAQAGAELTTDVLDDLEDAYLDARSHDRKVRTKFLAASWDWIRDEKGIDEAATYVVEKEVWKERREEDTEKLKIVTLGPTAVVTFTIDPPLTLILKPSDLVKFTEDELRLRDDTVAKGELVPSPIIMGVDALDFRHTAQRAEAEELDPFPVIEKTWLLTHEGHHDHGDEGEGHDVDHRNEFKKIWDCHMAWLKAETVRLEKKGRVPSENDKFRVNWDQIIAYRDVNAELEYDKEMVYEYARDPDDELVLYSSGLFDLKGFAGADHSEFEFPHLEIPRGKVGFESTFTPRWSTYYAIYFTITGLHGLHVIGGALVLGYYLFFGRKMYDSNPEWLANRVEIGGLFWHFVDLVWIFLFPILYLM